LHATTGVLGRVDVVGTEVLLDADEMAAVVEVVVEEAVAVTERAGRVMTIATVAETTPTTTRAVTITIPRINGERKGRFSDGGVPTV
jgi:polysaccharide deacetylase 2 family uncharacterized protein YibQ